MAVTLMDGAVAARSTDTAAMLWLFVAAMLLGWLVVLVSRHTIDFTP
jgi:hypothetical protein